MGDHFLGPQGAHGDFVFFGDLGVWDHFLGPQGADRKTDNSVGGGPFP